MKSKKISFLIALILARSAIVLLKFLKRNGTHYPGYIALKYCPDFLAHIAQPKKLIAITGTNGKTTSSNLILDIYQQTGLRIAHNSLGSNIQEGIITTLLKGSNFLGTHSIVDLVILEVDERVSPKIFPYIQPDYLLITNLFRDSYRRNASVEFIADILEKSIPAKTKLIVNADDVISSFLCLKNERFVFSLEPLVHEEEIRDSLIKDVIYCPRCDHRLVYDFNRYHHLGKVHCDQCGFTNLKADISVTDIDHEVHVSYQGKRYSFSKLGENVTDYYNMISAISTCLYTGLSIESILSYFKKIELVKSRFNVSEKSGKRIIVMMSKDQNPVAASRVFDYIRKQTQRNTAIIYINENSDHHSGSENSSWYYDADFEYLKQDHIKQIIFGGWRVLDAKVRCLLAGIDESIIFLSPDEISTSILVDFSKVDDIYVLYGTKTEAEAHQVKEDLLKRIEKEI